MLVISIVCACLLFVPIPFAIVGYGMGYDFKMVQIITAIAFVCTVICSISLLTGIKRIKSSSGKAKGLSIATTAVGGVGTILGLIVIILGFIIAMVSYNYWQNI